MREICKQADSFIHVHASGPEQSTAALDYLRRAPHRVLVGATLLQMNHQQWMRKPRLHSHRAFITSGTNTDQERFNDIWGTDNTSNKNNQ